MNQHPLLTVLVLFVGLLLACLGILVGADPRGESTDRSLRLFAGTGVCALVAAFLWAF